MDKEQKLLSDIIVYSKYAKYRRELKRRENWDEIIDRSVMMHTEKYPNISDEINWAFQKVREKKVMPSMRSLQFAGKAIKTTPNRSYNCCFMPIDSIHSFSEAMFLLLGGTGVGYSVQKHHVEKLPTIVIPNKTKKRRYLVADNIEGWADTIKILLKTYFGFINYYPVFDFTDIRQKGSRLVTTGGKAPGAKPLKDAVTKITNLLEEKKTGEKLSTLECHDILCHIADAVLAGGIRRAAMISLFSASDELMFQCKSGRWYELNPQRGRANNSVVLIRHKLEYNYFIEIWNKISKMKTGEPGIYLSNDKEWGANPCVEIGLRPFQFCNLSEINVSDIVDENDLIERARAAAIIGTLQASYTDFHYLRNVWKTNTEKECLLGLSLTGIGSGKIFDYDLENIVKEVVIKTNEEIAQKIGIKTAARITCIKPSGTASLVLGTSSGIHSWYDEYYVRRMKIGKNEPIYQFLMKEIPELIEEDNERPFDTVQLAIPQKAPENCILRSKESIEDVLERLKYFKLNWIDPGHIYGSNTHNISTTIFVKDDEWEQLGEWMWENRDAYNGIATFPFDNNVYNQAPFETITKERYEELMKYVKDIDLTQIIEDDDNTNLSGEIACSGGSCEVKSL